MPSLKKFLNPADLLSAAFPGIMPAANAAVGMAFGDGATPSQAQQEKGADAEGLDAQASQFGQQEALLARRRRRRSSLLATMGMGDTSDLPMTMPSASPGKPNLGA